MTAAPAVETEATKGTGSWPVPPSAVIAYKD
jgi:hypothetical protein